MENFYDTRIGTIRGISYKGAFGKAIKENKLQLSEAADYQLLVQMLIHKRVSIVASPTASFLKSANLLGVSNKIVKLSYPLNAPISIHMPLLSD